VPSDARHELFGADPNDFVAARDQLARDLRAAGDKDEAAAIKKLRRPTVLVWALNQVSRADPDALGALLEASRAARTAQEQVLGGAEGDVLRDAVNARRRASARVLAAARDVIDRSGRASATHERELETALNAVVASERLTDALERGELTTVESGDAEASDDLLASLSASAAIARPRLRAVQDKERVPSPRLRAAQEKLERHRAEAEAAAAELRDAEHALKTAEAAFARAERDLTAAQRSADAARKVFDRAEQAQARSEEAVAALEGE
jgi:hypothetical protein